MKKFLKNLLMEHLIDIVINEGLKIINFLNTILYLNTLNRIFTGKFGLKSIIKC